MIDLYVCRQILYSWPTSQHSSTTQQAQGSSDQSMSVDNHLLSSSVSLSQSEQLSKFVDFYETA